MRLILYTINQRQMTLMENREFEDVVREENRIQQATIDDLPRPSFVTIEDEDITDYIYEFCKNLLLFSKEKHESKEMAYAINLSTLDFVGTDFGVVYNKF